MPPPAVLLIFLFGFLHLGLMLNSVQLWSGQFECDGCWTPSHFVYLCIFLLEEDLRRPFLGLFQAEALKPPFVLFVWF